MILLNSGKLSIKGVDVYPDHEEKTKFWYVPTEIKLAERDQRKILSYFWYTDSTSDTDGTGFLNFEVNTAVPDSTLTEIKSTLAAKHKVQSAQITLSKVDYKGGRVSFSVLGPMARTTQANAAAAAELQRDPTCTYQSAEQLVWNAGSSSLVGDNAAVCSVKFTKEGKLAAAMQQAILNKSNSISATYYLEFLAMRPAVTFKVKGELSKVIDQFQAELKATVPLEAVILEGSLGAAFEKVKSSTDLQIELINYTGEDKQEGLEFAKKVVLEYVLKNFFEVDIGPGNVKLLKDAPEADKAVTAATEIDANAREEAEDNPDLEDDPPSPTPTKPDTTKPEASKPEDTTPEGMPTEETTPDEEEPPPPPTRPAPPPPKPEATSTTSTATSTTSGGSQPQAPESTTTTTTTSGTKQTKSDFVKSALAAANIPIPQVKFHAKYYRGEQKNTIDFMYSEMKATIVPVAPQSVVFEGLERPSEYVLAVNRSAVPFGLTFPVTVALPNTTARNESGLSAMNVQARYANSLPDAPAPPKSLAIANGSVKGDNPMVFQFDKKGNRAIDYTAAFVFDPGQNWNTTTYEYKLSGSTETGLIAAQPHAFLEFLRIDAVLPTDFLWGDDVDQAVVSLHSSARWGSTPKTLVFQKGGRTTPQSLHVRGPRADKPEPVTYSVELLKRGKRVQAFDAEPVVDNLITLRDRYASRVPLYFEPDFEGDVTKVILQLAYADTEHTYKWNSRVTLTADEPLVVNVPTVKAFADPSDLQIDCTFIPNKGARYSGKLTGGDTIFVTGVKS